MDSPLFDCFQQELFETYPSFVDKYGIQFKQSMIYEGYPEYQIVWNKSIPDDLQKLSQKIIDFGKLFQIRIVPIDIYKQ